MEIFYKVLRVFKNKYVFSFILFAFILLFIDHNNIFEQFERKKQLNKLLVTKQFYEDQINQTRKILFDLQNNPASLEKYAREKFYMKKDDEDLFVVENPADTTGK